MLHGFKNINSRYRCAKNIQRYAYRIPGIFLKEPVEQRKQKDKLKVAGRHSALALTDLAININCRLRLPSLLDFRDCYQQTGVSVFGISVTH